jgi:hypothetical protein
MADKTAMLTGTIDDYLLGLADGLQKAQTQLNQVSLVMQKDETPITYQIPRLDFELRLSFEMVTSQDGESARQLLFRTSGGNSSTRQSTAEATSTIRGTLVAVPRSAGKPQPIIQTTLRRVSSDCLHVVVTMATAAGEKLAGVAVHFNVDRSRSRELTARLSNLPAGASPNPLGRTKFHDGVVETDLTGTAIGILNIDPDEPAGKCIAALVDVLGQTESIMLQRD